MHLYHLNNFKGGWVAGNFDPSIFKTENFEVSVKCYKANDKDAKHVHKEAEELTIIVSGMATMNNKIYRAGDMILIEKGESTDFIAISDVVTCVIKVPSVIGDKYLV